MAEVRLAELVAALPPYLTERMLHQSEALAPLAAVAVQNRERLDGSGYPKGLCGGAIGRPARILGAVDAYRSMREPCGRRRATTSSTSTRRSTRPRGWPRACSRPSTACSERWGNRPRPSQLHRHMLAA
jgi:HD domain